MSLHFCLCFKPNPQLDDYNVDQRVDQFIQIFKSKYLNYSRFVKQSYMGFDLSMKMLNFELLMNLPFIYVLFRLNHILLPFGADFAYQAAEINFRFIDQLIYHVNKN